MATAKAAPVSTRIISIDAESNGLGGRVFAVAMTLSTAAGEQDHALFRCPINAEIDPWVVQHVLPAIVDVPENHATYQQLLDAVARIYVYWGGRAVPLIAHVAWPVEARLLAHAFPGDRVWDGPYPLIDVASVLLAKGHDPLSVDNYLRAHDIPLPEGNPHHPLYDARAAERCYRHLMAAPVVVPAPPAGRDPRHIVEFTNDGPTLHHPTDCVLAVCPVLRAALWRATDPLDEYPAGRYECEAGDLGDLVHVLDRVDGQEVAGE